jgi:hypothetical protein
MESRIQEHGIFNSNFKGNGIHLIPLDAICEKIDNSQDARKRNTDTSNRVDVTIQKYSSDKLVYVDNIGMTREDFKNYGNIYRSSNNKDNGIGKHGLGGKVADFQLCGGQGKAIHISNKDGYRYQLWDFDNMLIQYDIGDNHLLTNNIIDSPEFNTLNELINHLENLVYDTISANDIKTIVSPFFDSGPHTVTIYINNDQDKFNDIWKEIEEEHNKKKLGTIYNPLLRECNNNLNEESLRIKFKSPNRSDEVFKYDPLHVNDLYNKFGNISDGKIIHNGKNVYEEKVIPVYTDYNTGNYYIDYSPIKKDTTNPKKERNPLPLDKKYYKLDKNKSKIVAVDNLPHLDNNNPSTYIKFKASCLWPLQDLNIDKSKEYGGFHIYKLGRRPGQPFYPSGVRSNENGGFRFSIEIDDTNLDKLYEPGINKNKIKPSTSLQNMSKAFYNIFRWQFPTKQKEFEEQTNNDQPNNEQTNNDQPNNEQTNNEQTNNDQPNNDQINNDQPNNDQPNNDQINNDQINNDQLNNDQTNNDQPNNDQPNNDQPNNDQPNNDQPNNEQTNNEQTNNDQPNNDQEDPTNNDQEEQPNNEIPSAGQYCYREGSNVLIPKKWTNKKKFEFLKSLFTSSLSKMNGIDSNSLDDENDEFDRDFVKSCDKMKDTIEKLLVE